VPTMVHAENNKEMSVNYYPHHIGDYTTATAHLSMLEDCAYRRLLDIYYTNERPLPKTQAELYRLVRARSHQEKLAVDIVIGEFFIETPDGWRNKRADEEILKAKEKSELARHSAEMRWHRRSNANAMRTHSEGNAPNNQEPITKNQKIDRGVQRSRGSRLPSDWQPSEILKAWACKERPDLDLAVVIPKFRDYWSAVPGSKGVKLDWEATFRNFIRSERAGARSSAVPDYSQVIAEIASQEK
jgi:uncharacterized protein YdaU (DUF1376 family)